MNKLIISAISLLFPISCFAWGEEGHEAVCEIAYLELTNTARIEVNQLVSQERDRRFSSFRQACNWPDTRIPTTNARRNEHYFNLPRNWTYIRYERCETARSCLFTAIRQDESILRSSRSSDEEKWEALKFLGHWVGDLHQPLHISYSDDRGGNGVLIQNDLGCSENLHSVWDTCLPRELMADMNLNPRSSSDRERFAGELHSKITDSNRNEWLSDNRLTTWAEESLDIVRQPDVQYCTIVGGNCQYTENDLELIEHGYGENKRKIELTPAYENNFKDEAELRIKQAGIRLGAMLNSIFDPQ